MTGELMEQNETTERMTLSAEEREAVVAVNHCTPDGKIMEALVPVIERILAARAKAAEAEIADLRARLANMSDNLIECYATVLFATPPGSEA